MADCKSCKDKKNAADIDGQYAADIIAAYSERNAKRLWVALILTILLLVASNGLWIWHETQYVDESWTYEATTDDGGNAIANGDGEVTYYGESEGNAHQANP